MTDYPFHPDIRWRQRLANYTKALNQLSRFVERSDLNEMEEQGLIQSFECTYELAWNTLKDWFEQQGEINITGSRDAFRLAFKRGLIENGEAWMEMIKSRTLTSHTYNEEIAGHIARSIRTMYYPEFVRLQAKMETLTRENS